MSAGSWNAGIIRPVPVAPAGPYQDGAAPGVWTLDQAAFWTKQGLWPIAGNTAPIAFFGGGYTGSASNVIEKIIIATEGNATDVGDLTVARYTSGGASSSTRAVWGGGESATNVIDYVNYASIGNATDFGDLTLARGRTTGLSNYVRGVFGGGYTGSATNTIDYITIASAGNAIDFGDLIGSGGTQYIGACSSSTRGIFAGQVGGTYGNVIQYITIASTGNAKDFGDLTVAKYGLCGVSSETRGVFGGAINDAGSTITNVIEYVTIASTGNATDFGDLTGVNSIMGGVASSTRGVFAGGYTPSNSNVIQYITIASTGNATDFGDLTAGKYGAAGCSSVADAVQPTPTSSAMAFFFGGYTDTGISSVVSYTNIATTGNAYMFGEITTQQLKSDSASLGSSTRLVLGTGDNQNVVTIAYWEVASGGIQTTFGNLFLGVTNCHAACSSATRGVWAGGIRSGSTVTTAQYITIASTGNALSFGNLTVARANLSACASTTRGIFSGGTTTASASGATNTIDYITIASTGNASDFGDLLATTERLASCSSSTRGLIAGGQNTSSISTNVIQYVTIASTGNATDFGDLNTADKNFCSASSETRGLFAGGETVNTIQYVTIASTGNATDFGDLLTPSYLLTACSNAHGGL